MTLLRPVSQIMPFSSYFKVLPVCLGVLLFFPLTGQSEAKTIHIGDGKGEIHIDSMKSMEEGDMVIIKHGTYAGGSISNLTNVTIVPEAPGVTFNGPIHIGKNKKVTIDGTTLAPATDGDTPATPEDTPKDAHSREIVYGYTFTGFDGHSFLPTWNNTDLTLKGMWFKNTSAVDGSGELMTYTGEPETTLYYNLTIDTAKFTGQATIYDGTWAPPKTYKNVNIGMVMKNIIFLNDGTQQNTKFFGQSVYKLVADHWIVIGPTINLHDVGIIVFHGNGTIKNFYRNGGWGYVARVWNVSLGEIADSYFYNVIDVNSTRYGTIDSRVDAGELAEKASMPVLGGNMHIFNVTSGNKYDVTNEYITPMLVLGTMSGNDGHQYTTEIKNCFGFHPIGGDQPLCLYANFSQGPPKAPIDQSNNMSIPGAAPATKYKGGALPSGYLADMIKFFPSEGSKLIGAGTPLPQVTTDIYGNPRSDSNDIGAVQHVEGNSDDKASQFFGETLKMLNDNPTMSSPEGELDPIHPIKPKDSKPTEATDSK